MKTKKCHICMKEVTQAYRVKTTPGKIWIFVCGVCCLLSKKREYYVYGGTWKGKNRG